MTATAFGPQGPNFTTIRPAGDPQVSGGLDTWMKNCSGPGATDGTYPTADFFNVIIGNMRVAVSGILGNGGLTGADNMLYNAIVTAPYAAASVRVFDAFGNKLGDMLP